MKTTSKIKTYLSYRDIHKIEARKKLNSDYAPYPFLEKFYGLHNKQHLKEETFTLLLFTTKRSGYFKPEALSIA